LTCCIPTACPSRRTSSAVLATVFGLLAIIIAIALTLVLLPLALVAFSAWVVQPMDDPRSGRSLGPAGSRRSSFSGFVAIPLAMLVAWVVWGGALP
jgi:hypothetical protein